MSAAGIELLTQIYPHLSNQNKDAIRRQIHWQDWEMIDTVHKLFDTFIKEGESKWKEEGIVLEYDGREKEPIKNVLAQLPFARQKSNDAADFRIFIKGRLYLIIERKTYVDMMGSITERNSMQHLKMMCVPIPHDRKFYLLEQVSEKQYQDAILYQQIGLGAASHRGLISLHQVEGAKIDTLLRDGFRLLETVSLFHTLFELLKLMEKMYDFNKRIIGRLKCEPESSEWKVDINSMPHILNMAAAGRANWWCSSDEDDENDESSDMLERLNGAIKQQQKSKRKSNASSTTDRWTLQLAQIPRMSVPKAKAVVQLYPTLLAFIHAAESNTLETWKVLQNAIIAAPNRKLGPALAQALIEWTGLTLTKPKAEPKRKKRKPKADSQISENGQKSTAVVPQIVVPMELGLAH